MIIAYTVIFGFFATAFMGLVASWIDRKVTARVQYRVGPPLHQPLTDIIKLLGKETMIPQGASPVLFLAMPVIGLASVVLASTVVWVNAISLDISLIGDLVVAVYLLTIPSVSIMLGGFVSGNPLASLGASREMKLILSYELPFILALAVPIIKSGYTINLSAIAAYQAQNGIFAGSPSGFIALLVGIICMQAKLGLVPFDVAEAETEIVGGPLIEYSGPGLAMYKLMKNMLLFTLPVFLMIVFLGGVNLKGWGILSTIGKFVLLVALVTVIRNTNPRLRVDQAVRFFWGPVTVLAVIAVILALKGF